MNRRREAKSVYTPVNVEAKHEFLCLTWRCYLLKGLTYLGLLLLTGCWSQCSRLHRAGESVFVGSGPHSAESPTEETNSKRRKETSASTVEPAGDEPATIAYIEPEITTDKGPQMPKLEEYLGRLPSGQKIKWRIEAAYGRWSAKAFNDPETGFHESIAGQPWKISKWFGGDGVLLDCQLFQADGTPVGPKRTKKFKILGKNPLDLSAKRYIASKQGTFRFAWAIAQHESRDSSNRIYNQFANGRAGKVGEHGAPGEPFFSPKEGNGWGIFQRDPTGNGQPPLTIAQVWNWHENVLSGIEELKVKEQKFAEPYFNALRAIYQPQGKWEEPPSHWVHPKTSTAMTALEVATIQCYNGGTWLVVTSDNKIVYDGKSFKRKRKPNEHYFLSCWHFLPDAPHGNKWSFEGSEYVFKVIREFENREPITE